MSGERQGASTQLPLIITCAITGDQRKIDNPRLPITLAEQVEAAKSAHKAGAAIIHIHGRDPLDPTKPATNPIQYSKINQAIRDAVPGVLMDNTQFSRALDGDHPLVGKAFAYTADLVEARPDIMSLNPGPMTFRGNASTPSGALVTTFDDTLRMAAVLRENGIKPQVFLYHPGHLDIFGELIAREVLAKPYFVQLVFGQNSGIVPGLESFQYMVRQLPTGTIFQTCALGRAAIEMNVLAMLYGGHVRTGMEDTLDYLPGISAGGNNQLVERIVRFANDLGRPIATVTQVRDLFGLAST